MHAAVVMWGIWSMCSRAVGAIHNRRASGALRLVRAQMSENMVQRQESESQNACKRCVPYPGLMSNWRRYAYFNNFSNSSTVSPAALIKCLNKRSFACRSACSKIEMGYRYNERDATKQHSNPAHSVNPVWNWWCIRMQAAHSTTDVRWGGLITAKDTHLLRSWVPATLVGRAGYADVVVFC